MPANNFPKLHNAAWPGLVGKGSPGAEPFIELDTMLDLTLRKRAGFATGSIGAYRNNTF